MLIDIYRDADINGWTKYNNILNSDYWTLILSYIEYLIAQNDFLFNIGDNAKKELIQIAKRKIEDKINSNSFNSISGISPSYYLIAHILNDKGLLKRTDSSFFFLKTGMIIDFQLIKDIEDSCEQFLNLK